MFVIILEYKLGYSRRNAVPFELTTEGEYNGK